MAKPVGIIAFFIVLIVMVILLLVLGHISLNINGKHSTTTSAATSVTTMGQSTTTVRVGSTTTAYNNTGYDCVSNSTIEPLTNGDFGTSTYEGWNLSGVGFGNAPLNIIYANNNSGYYGSPWSNYNGDFFATTYHGGLGLQTGNITSIPFLVTEPYLNFRIISPADNLIYVELIEDGRPIATVHYNTFGGSGAVSSSEFVNASIPLIGVLCKSISVRVVSGVVGTLSTKYDIVAAGDFYLSKIPVQTPGIIVNQTA